MKNGLHIDANGTKHWYLDDKLHREDGPAVVWADGSEGWYLHDKRHRLDGPAVVWADGTECWFIDGKCHRTDGPAEEWPNGIKRWFFKGKYLGPGDEGFWALWDRLTNKQRNNLNLLMHLPSK